MLMAKYFSFDQINQLVNQFEKYISLNIKKIGFLSNFQILNFIMFFIFTMFKTKYLIISFRF